MEKEERVLVVLKFLFAVENACIVGYAIKLLAEGGSKGWLEFFMLFSLYEISFISINSFNYKEKGLKVLIPNVIAMILCTLTPFLVFASIMYVGTYIVSRQIVSCLIMIIAFGILDLPLLYYFMFKIARNIMQKLVTTKKEAQT